jgi:hypothetical protein
MTRVGVLRQLLVAQSLRYRPSARSCADVERDALTRRGRKEDLAVDDATRAARSSTAGASAPSSTR